MFSHSGKLKYLTQKLIFYPEHFLAKDMKIRNHIIKNLSENLSPLFNIMLISISLYFLMRMD